VEPGVALPPWEVGEHLLNHEPCADAEDGLHDVAGGPAGGADLFRHHAGNHLHPGDDGDAADEAGEEGGEDDEGEEPAAEVLHE
jgi:hypothetical protein